MPVSYESSRHKYRERHAARQQNGRRNPQIIPVAVIKGDGHFRTVRLTGGLGDRGHGEPGGLVQYLHMPCETFGSDVVIAEMVIVSPTAHCVVHQYAQAILGHAASPAQCDQLGEESMTELSQAQTRPPRFRIAKLSADWINLELADSHSPTYSVI